MEKSICHKYGEFGMTGACMDGGIVILDNVTRSITEDELELQVYHRQLVS